MSGCAFLKGSEASESGPVFYNAGHRGTRGLMPENTIPAMKKGIMVGANTLEMDLQVTQDGKIVLNHDNTLNPFYVTRPDGSDIPQLPDKKRIDNSNIPKAEQKEYMIYDMKYSDIRRYIVGEKYYPDFPEQQRVKTYMPLLTEVIDSIEIFTKENYHAPVYYMPEIKSNPDYYGISQPYPEQFVRIVMEALRPYIKEIKRRIIFQCADLEPLQILHRDYPDIQLALLPHGRNVSIDEYIGKLGFKPDFYLPRYRAVTPELLNRCHSLGIKVIPWTPDDTAAMRKLVTMGVDGIITNYPDRLTGIMTRIEKN